MDDLGLARELLRMTDHYTDELFSPAGDERGGRAVVFPVSRLVVDPERFEDDTQEPMAAVGMGVIYTKSACGEPLRAEPPTLEERASLLERFYLPHHRKLEAAVNAALRTFGHCLVIDCHSFPSRPLPYEQDQDPDRPDICLGADDFHTPTDLLGAARRAFEAEGLSVAINRPFAGALVPMAFYRKDSRVSALMVEVNRGLYMDEGTGERTAVFRNIQAMLTRATGVIATSSADRSRAGTMTQP